MTVLGLNNNPPIIKFSTIKALIIEGCTRAGLNASNLYNVYVYPSINERKYNYEYLILTSKGVIEGGIMDLDPYRDNIVIPIKEQAQDFYYARS